MAVMSSFFSVEVAIAINWLYESPSGHDNG